MGYEGASEAKTNLRDKKAAITPNNLKLNSKRCASNGSKGTRSRKNDFELKSCFFLKQPPEVLFRRVVSYTPKETRY